MLCPYCACEELTVLESREAEDGKVTRRRRECVGCKKRFTTYERVGNIELKVIKKSGKVERFSREKLGKCVDKACFRMNEEDKEALIDELEMKLLNWKSVEIPSKEIALMVMNRLKKTDPMAYIRFATVYMNINSIKDFEKLLIDFKK
jgi:transcriptional repressor NrdR